MSTLLVDFLGRIERQEAALLSWGLVDGALAEAELHQLAEDFLAANDSAAEFSNPYLFLEALVSRGLLFRWDEGGSYRYRSRMAESLRLLARLRQMFPRHLRRAGDWALSPTLVSDFRFVLRPREYPRRDLPSADCLNRWIAGIRLSPLQQSALGAMLGLSTPRPNPLAGFQDRAATRILGEAGTGRPTGTMICAGTGSGKTLAFYVPALGHLVGSVERDSANFVRAIALYPRNELLKDQFTEVFRQTKRLKAVLTAAGRRPICVAAYFGPTPNKGRDTEDPENKNFWAERTEGRVCPFLVCPQPDCGGAMIWRNEDRARDVERLVCDSCAVPIEADEIMLTRTRMLRTPPDVLFTTTEMMNQRLTDARSCHLFGVGTPIGRKPSLVLLDEAHTYRGVHGAQAAYLLRRWRYLSHAKCHYAGLSATLMEAASFFAQLTGLSADNVEEVSPETAEMTKEGMEYMVALRGDPVSGASLLSTTIQTAMLLRRILDLNSGLPSTGTFGRKVFLFTDDLDVKNRMYFTLLDAEGQDAYGRPDPTKPGGSLANLRATTGMEDDRRFSFGQSWRLSEDLGHALRPQSYVHLGRVSSQDEGVDSDAEIIVATASLEVGFNDPGVGAVLQHKAPRDPAAFLQRKGRAGRPREMRPWTAIVLSDFGRDRLAYQAYDLLFDPELRPGDLPLGNRHVLKMQAACTVLDWMSHQLRSQGGHVWRDASAPATSHSGTWVESARARHNAAAAILERVLQGGDDLDHLTDWLRRALGLQNASEVQALLWEAPRALMTEVLPTWHRRLRTQWQRGAEEGTEYYRSNHPLPEFIPGTLFSELNLPEVIVMASPGPGRPEREHPMAIAGALREFAPGRISRRFGITHGMSRHWLPVDLTAVGPQEIDVNSFCAQQERDDLGVQIVHSGSQDAPVRILRPFVLHVRSDAPRDRVKDSSNAFLEWHTRFFPPDDAAVGMRLDLPAPSPWDDVVDEIRFFTHRHYQPISAWRFATGAHATINAAGGVTAELASRFVLRNGDQTELAALGFCFDVDAIRIRLRIPANWKLEGDSGYPGKLPALRVARFRWLLLNEPRFDGQLNQFERNWLAEIAISAISAIAVRDQCDLAAAWAAIRGGAGNLDLSTVLDVMFQTLPTEEDDPTARVEQARLQELRQMIADAAILAILDRLVPALWSAPDPSWHPWLRERYVATFAAAFRDAVQQSCPEVDASDLLIDLETDREDLATIWVTEDAPGGGGVVERLLPALAESPRRFLDLLHAALGESDFEITDSELQRILRLAASEPPFAQAMHAIRDAPTLAELTLRFQAFRALLNERGIRTTHGVLAGLSARVLRPGSNELTDQVALGLADRWSREEARLGLEIDQRSLVYALSHAEELDTALNNGALPIGPDQDRRIWRFNALGSIAWARGSHARNQGLGLWSPYASLPLPERWLLLDLLGAREPRVHFGSADWRRLCENQLIENGRIALTADRADLAALRSALVGLLANPLDIGSLLVYPRLRGIERTGTGLAVMLELVTAGQVSPDDEPLPVSTARLIVKTARGEREEIRDLLESLVAVELLAPGDELWLVSPWISDLALLDNRSGGYAGLEPAWPKRFLSLAELLVFALLKNPALRIFVVTRPVEHNQRFCSRLQNLAELEGCADRLAIDSSRAELHTKGLIATTFALNGSMNFTRSGVEVLEETVQLETEPTRIGLFRLNMHGHYK
ncbi:putative ATP-dependent helicase Lhr [Lacunisphaera limnophila]|uniref:Putative ATP-dependent helicase Lhr n=1 Tax=Lacunisphaera limnophila TaxID=1838286 RepID=A0A1D8AYZ3_9BACT|nr:protein DpdJ [Lacunisphaera limnophila]AOS46095.1 putative ATP-dependent helicase Lhr [Lacunisphaera limnophila]